jgi:hypothetical protein
MNFSSIDYLQIFNNPLDNIQVPHASEREIAAMPVKIKPALWGNDLCQRMRLSGVLKIDRSCPMMIYHLC